MLLLYLIHPTIMIEVLSSIPCHSVAGTGASFLQADMSIDCSSAKYKVYASISWVFLTIYIIGGILFLSYRLYHNAKTEKLFKVGRPAYKKYSFFVQGFKDDSYFWEAVVMGRKMAVAALSVLLNAYLQLAWANMILGISLFFHIHRRPYKNEQINQLETYTLLVLLATVMIGFHFLTISNPGMTPTALLIILNGGWVLVLLTKLLDRLRKWWKLIKVMIRKNIGVELKIKAFTDAPLLQEESE